MPDSCCCIPAPEECMPGSRVRGWRRQVCDHSDQRRMHSGQRRTLDNQMPDGGDSAETFIARIRVVSENPGCCLRSDPSLKSSTLSR